MHTKTFFLHIVHVRNKQSNMEKKFETPVVRSSMRRIYKFSEEMAQNFHVYFVFACYIFQNLKETSSQWTGAGPQRV